MGNSTKRLEIERVLLAPDAAALLMRSFGKIAEELPELAPMAGCPQNTPYHAYDVLEHTAYVVQASPNNELSRWAALLHDAGKPATRTTDSQGRDHFSGHPAKGAAIARSVALRLGMPKGFADDLALLVGLHEWFFVPTRQETLRAISRLGGRAELYRSLLELQIADNKAKAASYTDRLENARQRKRMLERIQAENTGASLLGSGQRA